MRRYLLVFALLLVPSLAQAQVGQPVNIRDMTTGAKAVVTSNGMLQVIQFPSPVGTHADAWNNASVSASGFSAVVDCRFATTVDVFGVVGSAGTISMQVSQDNVHFYSTDSVTLSGPGDFGFHVNLGSRYARLKSSTINTITATIAGKT